MEGAIMDLITLSMAKSYTNKVTAGFKSVELDGMNLVFTLLDGTKATVAIPAPDNGKDGISVQNLSIDNDGSLLCHMSDGSIIDAGKVPSIEVEYNWDNLEDKPFGEVEEKAIIIPKNIYTDGFNYEPEVFTPLIPGQEYTILYNDIEYKCIARDNMLHGLTWNGVGLGNGDLASDYYGEDTYVDYPFCILTRYNKPTFYYITYMDTNATIEVSLTSTTVKQIDEKFIPDTIATKEYVNNNTPEQIQSDWNQNDQTQPDYIKNRICYSDVSKNILIDNKEFTFVRNQYGRYEYTFTDDEKLQLTYKNDGELIFNGETYTAYRNYLVETDEYSGYYANIGDAKIHIKDTYMYITKYPSELDTENITITFSLIEENVIRIPIKYLPDNVATTGYIMAALRDEMKNYYTKEEVDAAIATAIAEALGTVETELSTLTTPEEEAE